MKLCVVVMILRPAAPLNTGTWIPGVPEIIMTNVKGYLNTGKTLVCFKGVLRSLPELRKYKASVKRSFFFYKIRVRKLRFENQRMVAHLTQQIVHRLIRNF